MMCCFTIRSLMIYLMMFFLDQRLDTAELAYLVNNIVLKIPEGKHSCG